uniref:Uncharacterized protein n=1 Tax=Rhizophora mucronata TaxID=61149 RepID=A0A2P2NBC5_RHIMU
MYSCGPSSSESQNELV